MREVGQEVRSGFRAGEYPRAKPDTSMKTNVGSYDAAVRFIAGCVILAIGAHHENWWGLIGLVPITTAVTGCCLLYLPFHLDTTFTDRPHA
jgi:hypothetical protein